MKITDIYNENEKSSPFLIDVEDLTKKIVFYSLLFVVIVFVSCGYWIHTYYARVNEKIAVKERFICDNYKCKIVFLNKNNVILPTPPNILFDIEFSRDKIGYMEVRHLDEPIISTSLVFGTRRHAYYIKLLPANLDMLKYKTSHIAELGPVSNEKYANEIFETIVKNRVCACTLYDVICDLIC